MLPRWVSGCNAARGRLPRPTAIRQREPCDIEVELREYGRETRLVAHGIVGLLCKTVRSQPKRIALRRGFKGDQPAYAITETEPREYQSQIAPLRLRRQGLESTQLRACFVELSGSAKDARGQSNPFGTVAECEELARLRGGLFAVPREIKHPGVPGIERDMVRVQRERTIAPSYRKTFTQSLAASSAQTLPSRTKYG